MRSERSWFVLANNSAGCRNIQETLLRVSNHFESQGIALKLLEQDELSMAIEREGAFAGLIIIGGDGTIHKVINRLSHQIENFSIGIIPVGTGNDFARQCGLMEHSIEELIDLFLTTDPDLVDLIKVEDSLGLQVLSAGFDAKVSRRARTLPGGFGSMRYVVAFVLQVISRSGVTGTNFRLTCDGKVIEVNALFVAIANGRNYGGGMLISPESDNRDGILEAVVVEPITRWKLVFLFPRIFTGSHLRHPKVRVLSGTHFSLAGRTVAEMDGESLPSLLQGVSISTRKAYVWTS